MNGDSCPDEIAGAPSDGGTGAAYIYFGGPGIHATPDITLTGEASGDLLGGCVAGAGDVNGDGYADIVVGSYAHSSALGPGRPSRRG